MKIKQALTLMLLICGGVNTANAWNTGNSPIVGGWAYGCGSGNYTSCNLLFFGDVQIGTIDLDNEYVDIQCKYGTADFGSFYKSFADSGQVFSNYHHLPGIFGVWQNAYRSGNGIYGNNGDHAGVQVDFDIPSRTFRGRDVTSRYPARSVGICVKGPD